jgi:diguanylate cyclase (GGDEF)-like protein/PAS domain S-box-containing protein
MAPDIDSLVSVQRMRAGTADGAPDLQWVTRLFGASPLGIFVADTEGRCIYANGAYLELAGLTIAQAYGTNWRRSVHLEDRRRVSTEWQRAGRDGQAFQSEARFLRRDGSVVWTRLHVAMTQGGGEQGTSLLIVEDITDRKSADAALRSAEEALYAEKERAQVTLDSIGDAVLTTDLDGNVTYQNLEAATVTGWSRDEALGRPMTQVFNILDGTTRKRAANPARRAIEENRTVGLALGCILVRRDGSEVEIEDSAAPIHNRDGGVAGAVIVFHDAAKSRAMAEKLAHLARHDFLTGLPNPALLTERLTQAIALGRRHHKEVALLFLDLDDFKAVNDTYGHLMGDRLLQSVAARLEACVRTTDTVCRRGGDEFVILLAEIEDPQDAARVAEKVLAVLLEPHVVEGVTLQTRASIGISLCPDDGDDADDLIKNADTAMYQAKAEGLSGYRYFGAGTLLLPVPDK